MIHKFGEEGAPKFYGATTVGERGQVVVPAQARTDLQITPGSKLLVFGGPHGHGLLLTKPEAVTEFVTRAMSTLTRFDEILKADVA